MIRRMKADTLRDLPAKERLQITVDPDQHMAQELQSAKVGYSRVRVKVRGQGMCDVSLAILCVLEGSLVFGTIMLIGLTSMHTLMHYLKGDCKQWLTSFDPNPNPNPTPTPPVPLRRRATRNSSGKWRMLEERSG